MVLQKDLQAAQPDDNILNSLPRFAVQAPMSSVPFGNRVRLIEEHARTLRSTLATNRCDLDFVYAAKRTEEEALADEEVRQTSLAAADAEVQACMSSRQRLLFSDRAGPIVAIEAAVAQRSYTPTLSVRGTLLDRTTLPERRNQLSEISAKESAWESEASKRRQQKLFGLPGGAAMAVEVALGPMSSLSGRRSRMGTPQAWMAQGQTEIVAPVELPTAESSAEQRSDHPVVSSPWRPASRASQYTPRGPSPNCGASSSRAPSRTSHPCLAECVFTVQAPVGTAKAIPEPARHGDTIVPPSLTEPAAGVPKPTTILVRPRSALGAAGNMRARLAGAEWKAKRNCRHLFAQRLDLDLVLEARRRQEAMFEGLAT